MSINWVMLHETDGFVRLPNERIIYTSPPRTSISLEPASSHSGAERFSRSSSVGRVHLTNQRIVYLPAESTAQFQSFSAPLLNIFDTHVSAPFFGPNTWTAQVRPVPGGGIPPSDVAVQLKMTFKDGGAFDFHTNFERIKERLLQVVEQARESGAIAGDGAQTGTARRGAGAFGAVNFASVHLEELPAYQGPDSDGSLSGPSGDEVRARDFLRSGPVGGTDSAGADQFGAPSEPPPGYEEVQQQSVATDLENRLRSAH